MSFLDALPVEPITLEKKDGQVIDGIRAHVQPKLIVTDAVNIDFAEGDVLRRRLLNGRDELYLIEEANLWPAQAGLTAHYQIKVRKLSTSTPVAVAARDVGTTPKQNGLSSNGRVRIFISHSAEDAEVAERLTLLLRAALPGIKASEIRCTSVEGHKLPGGANTDSQLKEEIRAADTFIGIVSPRSVKSMYVLFELGARWGADKQLIPLLAPGAGVSELVGPMKGINALRADRPAQVHQLLDELASALNTELESPQRYQRQMDALIAAPVAPAPASAAAGPPAASSPSHLLSGVTDDEAELLSAAAADSSGGVLVLNTNMGLIVQANGKDFVQPNNPRSEARWRDALDELTAKGFLRQDKSLWLVTSKGFRAADLLTKS